MIYLILLLFPLICRGKSLNADSTDNESKGKLVFAHVLYRHGDRGPESPYPTDPYGQETWPQGPRELTTKGMMQHYQLGKFLRKRYSKFLNKSYLVKEIYVRSSDKNRALQSALANLAGLYPPRDYQIWNPTLLWQPIPIHAVPIDADYLLVVDNPCPKYDQVFVNQTQSVIDFYNKQYADFFASVKKSSGLKQLDFWSIGDIYDPLICESAHELKLPNWTRAIVNETSGQTVFELIVDLKNIAKNLKYNSDEKAKLTGGYLLGDILTRLKTVIASGVNASKDRKDPKGLESTKMVMYSAHDDTVMALLYAMNVVKSPFLVPYAATVLIDLFQNKKGNYYVEVRYKNETPVVDLCRSKRNKSPRCDQSSDDSSSSSGGKKRSSSHSSSMLKLVIPGCPGFKCPLDTFATALWNRTSFPLSKRLADCGIKDIGELPKLHKSLVRDRL